MYLGFMVTVWFSKETKCKTLIAYVLLALLLALNSPLKILKQNKNVSNKIKNKYETASNRLIFFLFRE